MRDTEFDQYAKGANELFMWKYSIERAFERGKKVNKTKYHKICRLYEERLKKAKELCPPGRFMPPPLPPANYLKPPPRQPKRRND